MASNLLVHEIYLSIQGESSFAGLPCVFVRLTGCDLRCSFCDTAYAFQGGESMAVAAVIKQVEGLGRSLGVSRGLRLPLVELTGGEPLLQKNSFDLMTLLADKGYTVLVETSGAHDISGIDPRIRRIMDLKCPSSGEMGRNRLENLEYLSDSDEVKFVIASREDYQWARNFVREHKLDQRCEVLFSWVNPLTEEQRDSQLKGVPVGQTLISRQMLVDWIIEDQLPVRFQLQLHKHIWNPDQKGV